MLRGRKSTREPDLDDTSGGIDDTYIIYFNFFWYSKEIFYFLGGIMKKNEIQKITLTSVFAAIAFVFGLLTKYVPGLNIEMPQGGSIFGFPMIPIVMIGFILGVRYGVLAGFIYGLTSIMLDGGLYHWGSLFFDYLIAFGVLGLTGLFRKDLHHPIRFVLAILCVGFLRYISHGLSGVILFAEFAPEGMNPWFYSFIIYNLPYMLSSTFFTCLVASLLRKKMIVLTEQFGLSQDSE
jgi:thiamine transporter